MEMVENEKSIRDLAFGKPKQVVNKTKDHEFEDWGI